MPAAAKPKPAPAAKEETGTDYVVFVKTPDGHWRKIADRKAVNDIAAIRPLIELLKFDNGGEFVAVPARSFRVRKVTVATVTNTKIA